MDDTPEIDMLDFYFRPATGELKVSVVAGGKMHVYRITRERMLRAMASGHVAFAETERALPPSTDSSPQPAHAVPEAPHG